MSLAQDRLVPEKYYIFDQIKSSISFKLNSTEQMYFNIANETSLSMPEYVALIAKCTEAVKGISINIS